MKKTTYRVTEGNINDFYGDASTDEIEKKQRDGFTADEINDLARGWEMPVNEVMNMVEEI